MLPAADVAGSPMVAAPPRIKLLYLRDTTIVCGPGKTILNTWRTLNPERFALTIASTRPAEGSRNALLDRATSLKADVLPFDIGGGADVAGALRLARVLREGRFDILQTHDAQTRRMGIMAAKLAGVVHITSVHGWIYNTRKERTARWLDRRLIRLADHVIVISDRLRQEVMAAGTPNERVTLLRNAVLLDDYAEPGRGSSLRRELRIPDDHVVFSIIGRLSLEKGHDIFVKAARAVASRHANVSFLIVGDGPLRAQLEADVKGCGLAGRILFTGHRADMAEVYGATTVVVSTSYTEGIPNVLLEGFAYGRPTVATPVGGVPEIMSDGVEGWLIQPGDADALVDRLEQMLGSPATVAEMGARARRAIANRFDFRRRTRDLETLYEAALSRRRKAARGPSVIRRAAGFARRAAKRAIQLSDPMLHPRRRTRAIAQLPANVSTVLVVCYGNICRSPFAAAALTKHLGPLGPRVESAGFFGPHRPSPDQALIVAKRCGVDLDRHRSKLVDDERAQSADVIVVMDQSHVDQLRTRFDVDPRKIAWLGDFDPEPVRTRAIPDPYGGDASVFEGCYRRIARCSARLAAALGPTANAGAPHTHPRAR